MSRNTVKPQTKCDLLKLWDYNSLREKIGALYAKIGLKIDKIPILDDWPLKLAS